MVLRIALPAPEIAHYRWPEPDLSGHVAMVWREWGLAAWGRMAAWCPKDAGGDSGPGGALHGSGRPASGGASAASGGDAVASGGDAGRVPVPGVRPG